MKLVHSKNRIASAPDVAVARILHGVSPENLRRFVETLAFPRHYIAEPHANLRARDLLLQLTTSFGYTPFCQGSYDNIVITSPVSTDGPLLLFGAHYDSVPDTPGADDNASAVAVCLECARLIRDHDIGSVMIVFFNREEDGLLGSREFVEHAQSAWDLGEAHIFEMVGYRDHTPGSQRTPPGLPLIAPNVGNFLGLLANWTSNAVADDLVTLAASYVQSPVLALKIYFGLESAFGHLNRSDHVPFWKAGIPCIMWTDTSEFRNPHYHRASDTPDTLDYDFMSDVTKLALARAVLSSRG